MGLGFFSLLLDLVFLTQHYVLYPGNPSYDELTDLMNDQLPGYTSRADTFDNDVEVLSDASDDVAAQQDDEKPLLKAQ